MFGNRPIKAWPIGTALAPSGGGNCVQCEAPLYICPQRGAMAEGGAMRATKDVKEMLLELKHSFWLPPFQVRAPHLS
jgi:hypothetical protein